MRDTSWGLERAGGVLANFSSFDLNTFFARLNLFALISPLIYFLLLLLVFRRTHASDFNGFLLSGAFSGIVFALTWKSAIGLYSDWNLFPSPCCRRYSYSPTIWSATLKYPFEGS